MKALRDYQIAAINGGNGFPGINQALRDNKSAVAVLATGLGKCLGKGTPVLMFDGMIKSVEDVQVGELLMGPDSKPRHVLALGRGRSPMYRVTPTKGDPYTVNEEHILSLKLTPRRSGDVHELVNISIKEYLSSHSTFKHRAKGWRAAVDWAEERIPFHPYLLGLWLGDGTRRGFVISKPDPEVREAVASEADLCGLRLVNRNRRTPHKCPSWAASTDKGRPNPLYRILKRLGVTKSKHVPHVYKANCRYIRFEVLAGLIDSDGSLADGCYDYLSKDKQLSEDVAFLARSLGFSAYVVQCEKGCQNGFRGTYWRVCISGDISQIPVRISRRKAKTRRQIKDVTVTGIRVDPIGEGDYYGFQIDGDGLFMLGDFTVTHNTVLISRIASEWQHGNVLCLAHKIELVDQMADALSHELGYRPTVEQGERGVDPDLLFQGSQVIVGCVPSMISPKRMAKFKKHPFGLIIVDECHRATSPSYIKLIDHYREIDPELRVLGVTATPNRTDGTALGLVFDTVAYQMGIVEGIDNGWLVDIHQKFVVLGDVDFGSISTKRNQFGEADFSQEELQAILSEEATLHKMTTPLLDMTPNGEQAIIFCASVAHARMWASILNRDGYRKGCAAAVDCETTPRERQTFVNDFKAGKLQFLLNYGVFTEGFDAPSTRFVVMGRPTKSLLVYTQMLGRGTRALPGVVDGVETIEGRKDAIAASGKPFVTVLDYVGNTKHKIVTATDVLGGNFDVDVREEASGLLSNKSGNVREAISKARAAMILASEERRRQGLTFEAGGYEVHDSGGFGADGVGVRQERTRGGATDGQVAFLVNLGVARATALAYSRKQAGAVITSLRAKRCTGKQAQILQRFGIDPTGYNVDTASLKIDQLKASGWAVAR